MATVLAARMEPEYDDIRLRYLGHVSAVKQHALAAFKEQTDWLTLHLDGIRQRYPIAPQGKSKAKKKEQKAKKARKAKEVVQRQEDRPAFNDLIKSPRKRPQAAAAPNTAAAPPPKLTLLAAADPNVRSLAPPSAIASPTKPHSGASSRSGAAAKRATSPLSPRQAPNQPFAIFAPPGSTSSRSREDKENGPMSPSSAKSGRGPSIRERTPSVPNKVLSPPASRSSKASAKEDKPVEPAPALERQLSAISEGQEDDIVTDAQMQPAQTEPEKEDNSAIPEADEDEPPVPPAREPSPLPPSNASSAPSLLIPTSLASTLSTTVTAPTSLPSLNPVPRRTLGAPAAPVAVGPLPPSPSSAFLGRMGLAIPPALGRAGPAAATATSSTITASSIFGGSTAPTSAFLSPRSSALNPPPLLGSFGLSLKRSSAAAELNHSTNAKSARTADANPTKTPGAGAARLESVKEALNKMKSQRNSVAVSSAPVLGASLTAVAASKAVPAAAPVVAPVAQVQEPAPVRKISPIPSRRPSPELGPSKAGPNKGPRSSVGDLVKQFEQRRESLEASDRKLAPLPRRISASPQPPFPVAPAQQPVEPPHPTTTPPGSPPTMIAETAAKQAVGGEEEDIDEVGFEDGMVIEDSLAQAPRSDLPTSPAPLIQEREESSEQVEATVQKKPTSVLALAGLGPPRNDDSVIETQPIEFFDAEDDEEQQDPAAVLAAATFREYEMDVSAQQDRGEEDEDEDETKMTRMTGEPTQTMDLSTLAVKTLAAEKKAQEAKSQSTAAAAKGKARADDSQTTMDLTKRGPTPAPASTIRKTPSTASLASTKSNGGGLGGLFSKASSALATTWQGKKPEVKSLQLAAAAAKKEQEERERKMALKEERRVMLEKRQAEERVKLEEEKRIRAAEAERKRKEREEIFGKKVAPAPPPGSSSSTGTAFKPKPPMMSRMGSEEPGKKRKPEPTAIAPSEVKKVRPATTQPETPQTASNHNRVLKQTAAYQPSRPAPGPPASAIKPSAAAAAAVGVKTMNPPPSSSTIRVVGTGASTSTAVVKPKPPASGKPSSMHGIGKVRASQTLSVHPSNVWPPPAASSSSQQPAAQPPKDEPYVELPSIDSEYSDDDEDERERKNAALPSWAQSPFLREQLESQARIDPGTVFGPIPDLKMEELFRSKTSKFRMRTSSANWAGPDGLSAYEEAEYARRMGYRAGAASTSQSQSQR